MMVIDADWPMQIARIFDVPVAGPHGLDLDVEQRRLFCACDGRKLVTLDLARAARWMNETSAEYPM